MATRDTPGPSGASPDESAAELAGEQAVIRRLVLTREMGRQGYRWNRAFRRALWQRLTAHRSLFAGRGAPPPDGAEP
jgi:hypothetical protein